MLPPRILVPLIVASALMMENLDSTILSVALPTIARDFGVDPIHLKLGVTSYLLSLAVFIPASGWIADRFGARHVFRLAIIVFTIGSICCGLSNTIGELVAARVLQGVGGAMMVPVGRLILFRSVPKSELVGALAWLTMPALIGPVLGPPVGGFITTYFSWRWIFWINVPLGLIGIWMATRFIADVREEAPGRFDLVGFLLVGGGLATFVTGATTLGLDILPRGLVIALLGVGAVLLALYVRHAHRTPDPLLDLRLFRVPTFRIAVMSGNLFRVGVGATPFLLPLLFQIGFGFTAFHSGMLTFASALGAMGMKAASQRLLRRHGFRTVLLVNGVLCAFFLGIPAAFGPDSAAAVIIGTLLVGGFSRSLQFTAINAMAYADIEKARMGGATSLASVTQQVAISIGVSIGAITLETMQRINGSATLTLAEFPVAFLVIGLIALLPLLSYARLAPDAGAEVSGHRVGPKE